MLNTHKYLIKKFISSQNNEKKISLNQLLHKYNMKINKTRAWIIFSRALVYHKFKLKKKKSSISGVIQYICICVWNIAPVSSWLTMSSVKIFPDFTWHFRTCSDVITHDARPRQWRGWSVRDTSKLDDSSSERLRRWFSGICCYITINTINTINSDLTSVI